MLYLQYDKGIIYVIFTIVNVIWIHQICDIGIGNDYEMAQHFLLSAASRTLSLRSTYKAGEDAAYATFCQMRWPETAGMANRLSRRPSPALGVIACGQLIPPPSRPRAILL
jgi:hypothetical protein